MYRAFTEAIGYVSPSARDAGRYMNNIFNAMTLIRHDGVAGVKSIHMAIDGWAMPGNVTYLGVTGQFMNDQWQIWCARARVRLCMHTLMCMRSNAPLAFVYLEDASHTCCRTE